MLRFGACELDLDRFELRRDGQPVPLEPRALQVLIQLVEHHGTVLTKHELMDRVWGDRFVSESALSTQIKALRRAVGDTGREQQVIKTVHGRGYLFAADVEEGAATPAAAGRVHQDDRPVVGVLFRNLSPDSSRSHLCDGLSSDVVTSLAKHRWLRVLGRAATAGFVDAPDAIDRLRDELGATYVVEGTVLVDGDRLRVTASLTDTVSGQCRWAERYDRRIEDVFDVLDELTDLIVATIEPQVGKAERDRVTRSTRSDLGAWELFHLGISHFYRFTAEDNAEAQRLLMQARELDPGFAEPHAWWAYAVVLGMTYWDNEPEPEVLDAALAATDQALASDDHNAVFHMLRGRVLLARCDYASALVENQRAIDLNPTFAAAFCGMGDSLSYEGRYDEAIDRFSRSVELGSHDPQRWAFLSYGALALLFAHRFEEAAEWADRAAAIPNCQYWAVAHKVVALAHLDRRDECRRAVRTLLDMNPEFSIDHARRKLFYLKRPEQIELYLNGLQKAGLPERADPVAGRCP